MHYLLQINQFPHAFLKSKNYQQTILLPSLLEQKQKIESLQDSNPPLFEQMKLIFDETIGQIRLLLIINLQTIAPTMQNEESTLGFYLEGLRLGSAFPQEFNTLFPQTLLGQFYQPSDAIKDLYAKFYVQLPADKTIQLLDSNIEVPNDLNQLASTIIATSMHETEMKAKHEEEQAAAAQKAEIERQKLLKELEKEDKQKKEKEKKKKKAAAVAVAPVASEAGPAEEPADSTIKALTDDFKEDEQLVINYTKTIKNWFKNPENLIAFYNYQGEPTEKASKQEKTRQNAYKNLLQKHKNNAAAALQEITDNHTLPTEMDSYLIKYNTPLKVTDGYSVYAPVLKKSKYSNNYSTGNFELLFTKNPNGSLTVFHRLLKDVAKTDLLDFEQKKKKIEKETEEVLTKKLQDLDDDLEDWQAAGETIIDDTHQEYTQFINGDTEYYLLKH